MLKFLNYNKINLTCILAVVIFLCVLYCQRRDDAVASVNAVPDLPSKQTSHRNTEPSSGKINPKKQVFALEELKLNLNEEIYNNSSAIYMQIINFAELNKNRISDIWYFCKRYNDNNSHILKAALLSMLMDHDLETYKRIVSEMTEEEFSLYSDSMQEQISKYVKSISNESIIDLIQWNRSNPIYKFDMKLLTAKLTNTELLGLQVDNTTQNTDDCDKEIARRFAAGRIAVSELGELYKANSAISYAYGNVLGLKVFELGNQGFDPRSYMNNELVVRGAADQVSRKLDSAEIVDSVSKFDSVNTKRMFTYIASIDNQIAENCIRLLLDGNVNADYPIAGYVEYSIKSKPNISSETLEHLRALAEKVQNSDIRLQLQNSLD